jgi:formate hydrogenlyase subunit 4
MKRIVGIGMIVLAFLLCPVWVTVIPESEPEIGVVALIAILYLIAIGLVLSSSSSDTSH